MSDLRGLHDSSRRWLIVAAIAMALSLLSGWIDAEGIAATRSVPVLVAFLAAMRAVRCGYERWRVWLGAAIVAAIGSYAFDRDWDTLRVVARLACVAALLGAMIAAAPMRWRLRIASTLLVAHFAAILIAVTLEPVPGYEAGWIPSQLYARLFQPYLEFTMLNNPYNFYSPEPPSEVLLWFHVEYADGSAQWVKVPDRAKSVSDLDYSRLATVGEFMGRSSMFPENLQEIVQDRLTEDLVVPPIDGDVGDQFFQPTTDALRAIRSYVRHVIGATPHPDDPSIEVTGVKVYRVVHQTLTPEEFAEDGNPGDASLYLPYYLGEHGLDGELKPSCCRYETTDEGEIYEVRDPLLYWLIPIYRNEDGSLLNYVERHAGGKPSRGEPWKTQ